MFSERTGLYLTLWHGIHLDVEATWLRWADADGVLLPTAPERAEQFRVKAESAEREAESAQRKAESAQRKAESAQREMESAQREAELAQQKTQELEALLAKYRAQFGDLAE
jgi:chromosome segregation ATPase